MNLELIGGEAGDRTPARQIAALEAVCENLKCGGSCRRRDRRRRQHDNYNQTKGCAEAPESL
jgi:hypothetical protein